MAVLTGAYMITVQDFAEQLLCGQTLADKLIKPSGLQYQSVVQGKALPKVPSRPSHLQFSQERLPFPKHFADDHARAQALHFFANHELLAIELMALCLLKFPDSPIPFQKGLVHTITEEQEHLRLYLDRLQELGGEVGEVPVNGFFWDCLSGMTDPMDFVVGMSMTFEQANLDHCIHYGKLFGDVGDTKTVGILDQVYKDEIRHLRHGLHWFRKWKAPQEADFFVHEKSLSLPMSVMRAKGLTFDREGRERAGFDTDYINQLEVYSLSKGRPSDVYVFTPNVELDHANQQPKKIALTMERALAPLMMVLCKKDDILLTEPLPQETLLALKQVQFPLPQQVSTWEDLSERFLGTVRTWGTSQKISERFGTDWKAEWTSIFGKSWGASCLQKLLGQYPEAYWTDETTVGRVCTDWSDVERAVQYFESVGYTRFIAKTNFSTAGRGAKRFDDLGEVQGWLERALRHQEVVVEPCFERVVDFSIQLDVQSNRTKVLAIGRFETDNQGQYLGHHLAAMHAGLDRDLLRFLHGEGKDSQRLRRLGNQVADVVGKALQDVGYTGPAGIDAMIVRTSSGYKIRPIVEVNPRYTMGRIAHELSKYVHPKSKGWFGILPTKMFFAQYGEPTMRVEGGKWREGVQLLTDVEYPVVGFVRVQL